MMKQTRVVLFLLLMISPVAAVAQTNAESEARAAAVTANDAFEVKDYRTAADDFRRAFALWPSPPFLVGEAVALHASGDCPSAVGVAERWFGLETNPPPEQLADMSRLVASCAIRDADTALAANDWDAAEAQAMRASDRDDSQRTKDDVARVREAIAKGRAESVAEVVEPSPEPGVKSGGNTQRIIGWTLVGLGAGAAGFAVAQQLSFNTKSEKYEEAYDAAGCSKDSQTCSGSKPQYDKAAELREPAQTAKTLTIVGWSAAGVLGAAGLTMVLLSGNGAEVAWVPPAGASVSVRF